MKMNGFNYMASPADLYEEVKLKSKKAELNMATIFERPDEAPVYIAATDDIVEEKVVWLVIVTNLRMAFPMRISIEELSMISNCAEACMMQLLRPAIKSMAAELMSAVFPKEAMN